MTLKNKLISAAVSGFAIAAFSTFAAAQDTTTTTTQTDAPKQERPDGFHRHGGHNGFGKGRHGGPGMMGGFRDLNLTDAQKQQIHSIMEANRPDQASFGERKTLMEAKRNGTLTADQQNQLKALHEQERAKGKQVQEQILAVLTPEQRTQLEQKRQEMRERHEQFRQNREQQKSEQTTTPPQNN